MASVDALEFRDWVNSPFAEEPIVDGPFVEETMQPSMATGDACEDAGLPICRAITDQCGLPSLPPQVISGVIYQGGKLLVTGASKSGKSFLLIELAVAIAVGGKWLGFQCRKGRVLFVNLELQEPMFMRRVFDVCNSLCLGDGAVGDNLDVYNARGRYTDIRDLVNDLTKHCEAGHYDVVVVDPAYKVQSGSENDADSITAFCAELDRLAEALKCTIAYSHHHPKGNQGNRDALDRGSGSGVFARDADAIIDMTELDCDDQSGNGKPFRLEFVLRDFKEQAPREAWFVYPVHVVDESGALSTCDYKGGKSTKKRQGEKLKQLETKLDEFMGDYDEVPRKDFVAIAGMGERTVSKYLQASKRFEIVSDVNSSTIRRRKD